MSKLIQLTIEEKRRSKHSRYKALTIRQPYASMIVKKKKTIEVRSKPTNFRGDVVITSSKTPQYETLKSGVALCIAEIYDCREYHRKDFYLSKFLPNDYDDKKYYSWYLRNIRPIEPFETNGQLGIWTLYTNKKIKIKGLQIKTRINDLLRKLFKCIY